MGYSDPTLRRYGNLAIADFVGQYVVAATGIMRLPIQQLGLMHGCESAIQKKKDECDVWAGFHFDPPVYAVVTRDKNGYASIIASGMDIIATKHFVKRAIRKSGMTLANYVNKRLRQRILDTLSDNGSALLEEPQDDTSQSWEDYFGAEQYAAFLKEYKGVNSAEGKKIASQRFGVTLQNTTRN